MDFRISEEQRAFVDTVRRICQKDFKARAIRYLDGTWPAENMKSLAELARALPRGKLVNLEGFDYGIHFLAPERCVKAVRDFLTSQDRGT